MSKASEIRERFEHEYKITGGRLRYEEYQIRILLAILEALEDKVVALQTKRR